MSELSFIDAYGLVGTSCTIRAAAAKREEVAISLPRRKGIREHLASMGFRALLEDLGEGPSLPAASPAPASGVVVPLRSAREAGGDQALSHLLFEQLRDHVDPQVLQAIAEGVWEMVGNALEHSGSDASVMGQVYWTRRGGRPPDHDDRVHVVIGDIGRGIRGSFLATRSHEPADDMEAINLALEYLVSSVVDDPGRGQGLSTTREQVTALNGRMIVRSGDAKVTLTTKGTAEERVAGVPGVIVALDLPLYPG